MAWRTRRPRVDLARESTGVVTDQLGLPVRRLTHQRLRGPHLQRRQNQERLQERRRFHGRGWHHRPRQTTTTGITTAKTTLHVGVGVEEPHERQAALWVFDDEVYAASSCGTQAARGGILQKLLAPWEVPLLPLTPDKIRLLGAALKAGGYRSARQYLATAVQLAERRGQVLCPPSRTPRGPACGRLVRSTRLLGSHSKLLHNCFKPMKLQLDDEAPWPQLEQGLQGRGGCSARLSWPQGEHR